MANIRILALASPARLDARLAAQLRHVTLAHQGSISIPARLVPTAERHMEHTARHVMQTPANPAIATTTLSSARMRKHAHAQTIPHS